MLSPESLSVTLSADTNRLLAGSPTAQEEFRQEFRRRVAEALAARGRGERYADLHAGFVLAFGASPLGDNGARGVAVAERVNAVLATEPQFRDVVARNYLHFALSARALNDIEIELFFYIPSCR